MKGRTRDWDRSVDFPSAGHFPHDCNSQDLVSHMGSRDPSTLVIVAFPGALTGMRIGNLAAPQVVSAALPQHWLQRKQRALILMCHETPQQ